jgi:predicted protein tyrosine phosphatase
LFLTFKDRCEEEFGVEDWPDQLSNHLKIKYLGSIDERIFSSEDAAKIWQFFNEHHSSPDDLTLLVHCKSGVGRSAAIAQYFGTTFCIPWVGGKDPRFNPNSRVLRLLEKYK